MILLHFELMRTKLFFVVVKGAIKTRLCAVFRAEEQPDTRIIIGMLDTCVCTLLGGFAEIREKPDWKISVADYKK